MHLLNQRKYLMSLFSKWQMSPFFSRTPQFNVAKRLGFAVAIPHGNIQSLNWPAVLFQTIKICCGAMTDWHCPTFMLYFFLTSTVRSRPCCGYSGKIRIIKLTLYVNSWINVPLSTRLPNYSMIASIFFFHVNFLLYCQLFTFLKISS